MDYAQFHDDLLRDIEETAAALDAELERVRPLRDRLAELQKMEPQVARLAGRGPAATSPSVGGGTVEVPYRDAITTVLREAGGPIRAAMIRDRLVAKGYRPELDKNNIYSSACTVMAKNPKQFRRHGRGLWGLAEWDRAAVVPMDRADEAG